MAQYCRYCAHAHVADWLWCDIKEDFVTETRAKKPNTCKHFELNPIDAYGENPCEYHPRERKPKSNDQQMQMDFSSFLSETQK